MPCIQFQCPGHYLQIKHNAVYIFQAKPQPSPQFTLVFWQNILKASTECSYGLGLFCTYQQRSFSKQYTSCLTDIISCFYFSTVIMQNDDWKPFSNVSVRTLLQWISLLGYPQPWRHWLTVCVMGAPLCSAMLHSPLGAQPRPRSMHNPWEFVCGCTSAWNKQGEIHANVCRCLSLCLKYSTSKIFYVVVILCMNILHQN